jgi:NAD(P)-dependent dehydrogenase (short-subunit alcohol dehydrogenase family)
LFRCDITKDYEVQSLGNQIIESIGVPSGLVNNAAINPSVEGNSETFSRIEDISYKEWNHQFDVGLYGAFLCTKVFGNLMIDNGISGSVVNISSDHGLIAPNQSLYRIEGVPDDQQPVKPITYSVIKHGLIGLSKYFATYWALAGIRCNTLCPGGVANGQPQEFLSRFNDLVPLGRPAYSFEYRGAVVFLLSEDSSYMTGSTMVIDGGRSIW